MEHRDRPCIPAGTYRVVRETGLIPPFLRKRTDGTSGWTCLGPLPLLPFRLTAHEGLLELRYRPRLAGLVDLLAPAGDRAWSGIATWSGIRYGRFRLEPVGDPAPDGHDRPRPGAQA